MALGYILISVLHIFSFSSMFLSSTLLFVQPLPQTSETHTEILENHLQAQKKNLGHATPLWPHYLGYTKLSANFMPFPNLGSTEIKLEVEAPCGLRMSSSREGSPAWSTSLHCPFWDGCTLSTCEDVDKWTTYQLTPSVYQGDACLVPFFASPKWRKTSLLGQGCVLKPVLKYFRSACLRAGMRSHWNEILKCLWVCIIFSSDVWTSRA